MVVPLADDVTSLFCVLSVYPPGNSAPLRSSIWSCIQHKRDSFPDFRPLTAPHLVWPGLLHPPSSQRWFLFVICQCAHGLSERSGSSVVSTQHRQRMSARCPALAMQVNWHQDMCAASSFKGQMLAFPWSWGRLSNFCWDVIGCGSPCNGPDSEPLSWAFA